MPLVAACGGGPEVASDYLLSIVPRVLDGQDPFEGAPTVKLWIQEQGKSAEVIFAGTASQGVELGEQPPIPAGAVVGLIIEEGGASGAEWDPGRLTAWGSTVLGAELALGGADEQVSITVPLSGAVGDIGRLSASRAVIHGAAAMIPGGDVLVFGGTSDHLAAGNETNRILRLRDSDDGSWELEVLGVKLPSASAGLTATAVARDGQVRIVVASGCTERTTDRFITDTCTQWVGVFDPASETWVVDKARALTDPLGDHRAVAFNNGRVLLVGRFTALIDEYAPYSLYDAFDERVVADGTLDGIGSLGPMVAARGNDGALVCGGAVLTNVAAGTPVAPQTACYRIDLQGTTFPAAPLPDPTAYGAMVGLEGGKVLLTGGIVGDLNDDEVGPASAAVWRFTGSQWEQAGDLRSARAFHRMLPMHDGGALVVGGVSENGLWTYRAGDSVDCVERYDPGTSQFTKEGCTAAGAGAMPQASWWPGDGAFVLEGYDADGRGGGSYGLVGMGPPTE